MLDYTGLIGVKLVAHWERFFCSKHVFLRSILEKTFVANITNFFCNIFAQKQNLASLFLKQKKTFSGLWTFWFSSSFTKILVEYLHIIIPVLYSL